jgi:hypothetical protein
MRESRIFILKTFFPPIWARIKKITFVYREKEFYEAYSFGLWWKKYKGFGIKDKQLHFVQLMIGLRLINHVTWFEFKYYGKSKDSSKGLVTSNPEKYLK